MIGAGRGHARTEQEGRRGSRVEESQVAAAFEQGAKGARAEDPPPQASGKGPFVSVARAQHPSGGEAAALSRNPLAKGASAEVNNVDFSDMVDFSAAAAAAPRSGPGGPSGGEGDSDGELPEWELRERHLHPELAYASLRPHHLAYKRAKMNDGSRFVTGRVPGSAMDRRRLRKQQRYALSAEERQRGALSQAEMAAVAEEHRRRWPGRWDRGLRGLPGGGEVEEANVIASGVKRARKLELCEQMLPVVVCEQCPLAPLVGQRGARAGAGRRATRRGGIPFDDMG